MIIWVMMVMAIIIPVPVAEFSIDLSYFPLTLLLQRTDQSFLFIPIHVETPSYSLNFIIKILVDPGNLHIPFSFIGKSAVAIATVITEGEIGVNNYLAIFIPVIKIPLIKLPIVLLVILLIIALIGALIILSVIPGARLCLGHGEHSNNKQ